MDIIYRWAQLEADFQRHYRIKEPANLSWRRFMNLLTNLPIDVSVFYAPYYKAVMDGEEYVSEHSNKPPKGWAKKEMDRIRGRGNRPRQTVSVEQFVAESRNQGTKK